MKTLLALGVLLVAAPALAQDIEDARVVLARGDVTVRGATASVVATAGMVVSQGDQVRTGHDGSVRLLLGGAAVVDLSADTSMVVQHAKQSSGSSQTRLKVWSGRLWARVTKLFGAESTFEVETPNAVAGVRGTELVVDVAPSGETQLTVLDGAVAVSARDGGRQTLLEPGARISAKDTHSLVQSTASDSELRLLRTSSSAGSHLSPGEASLRFQQVAGHIQHGGGTTHLLSHDAMTRVQIPPIDIDPAQGRAHIHGTINIKD